jgi:hypothetical protein
MQRPVKRKGPKSSRRQRHGITPSDAAKDESTPERAAGTVGRGDVISESNCIYMDSQQPALPRLRRQARAGDHGGGEEPSNQEEAEEVVAGTLHGCV